MDIVHISRVSILSPPSRAEEPGFPTFKEVKRLAHDHSSGLYQSPYGVLTQEPHSLRAALEFLFVSPEPMKLLQLYFSLSLICKDNSSQGEPDSPTGSKRSI